MSASKRLRLVEEIVLDGEVVELRSIPFFREHLRPVFRRRLEGAAWSGEPIPVRREEGPSVLRAFEALAVGRELGARGAGGAAAGKIDQAVRILSKTLRLEVPTAVLEAAKIDPALLHEVRVARKLGIDLDLEDLRGDDDAAPASGAQKKKGKADG